MLVEQIHLSRRDSIVDWDVDVGRVKIAVVFGDFVLENRMVAEDLQRHLGEKTMILVQIIAVGTKDYVRLKWAGMQVEKLADFDQMLWKNVLGQTGNCRRDVAGVRAERPYRRFCLESSHLRGGADDPADFGCGVRREEVHDRAARADLDVVAVRAEAEDAQRAVSRLRNNQFQHGWPSRFQTAQNGLPLT